MIPPDLDEDVVAPEPSEPVDPEAGPKRKPLPLWIEFPLLVTVAMLIAIVIKTFLFQAFWIPSSSMEDTLQVYDRVLVSKITYQMSEIAHGDIIVFNDPRPGFEHPEEDLLERAVRNLAESIGLATPESEFIKRVIGLPGDVVEGRDGYVYLNNVRLIEDYLKDPLASTRSFGPVHIPPEFLFVMGDNRIASQDSRIFGPIPIDEVVGKAFVTIWPVSHWQGL